MSKYRHEYNFTIERHSWTCIGRDGAMQLNISGPRDGKWSGGLEQHRRYPGPYDGAPDHEDCFLLHGPCWHDGTSLYVEEYLIPKWLSLRGSSNEHQRMFKIMEQEYERRFSNDGGSE